MKKINTLSATFSLSLVFVTLSQAGVCTLTAPGGPWQCSGAAAPGTDTTQTIVGSSATAVSTTTDFGLTTAAGDGVLISGVGGTSFVGTNTGAITGAVSGIALANVGGGLASVTTLGNVDGIGNIGVYVENRANGSGLAINTGGSVSGAQHGVVGFNYDGGSLNITTQGPVLGRVQNGIWGYNFGTSVDATIVANGTITAGTPGITGAGNGILLVHGGTGVASVTTNGAIVASRDGMRIASSLENGSVAPSTAMVINANASITAGRDGIRASNNTTAGSVAINSSAASTITGQLNGVYLANQSGGAASIDLSGNVKGVSGNGILLSTATTGASSITTGGTVEGGLSGVLVESLRSNTAITVKDGSSISGTTSAISSSATFLGDTTPLTGNITINNAGTLKNSTNLSTSVALRLQSTGTNTVNNSGTIQGTANMASGVFNNTANGLWNTAGGTNTIAGASSQIVNSGLIISAASGAAGSTVTTFNVANIENKTGGEIRMLNGVLNDSTVINGNYIGAGGLVSFDSPLSADSASSDKLKITGTASGTINVKVGNVNGAGAITGAAGIQLITVDGANALSVRLASPVQAGAHEYFLNKKGNEWVLESQLIPVAPTPAPPQNIYRPAISGYSTARFANFDAGFAQLNNLTERRGVGCIRHTIDFQSSACDTSEINKSWGRIGAGNIRSKGFNQFDLNQSLSFLQVGRDLHVGNEADTNTLVTTGVMGGYNSSSNKTYNRQRTQGGLNPFTGTFTATGFALGGYYNRRTEDASYADFVAQVGSIENKFADIYDGHATQKGVALALSAEIGKAYPLSSDGKWSIEPQGQISYQSNRYKGFSDAISNINAISTQSVRTRLGGKVYWLDYSKDKNATDRSNVYVSANVLFDSVSPSSITLGALDVVEKLNNKPWLELGLGGELWMSTSTKLYGNANYQKGLSNTAQRNGMSGNLGLSVNY